MAVSGTATSVATAINSFGDICGNSDTDTTNVTHAFVKAHDSSTLTDLNPSGLGGTNSHAFGINSSANVAGDSDTTTAMVTHAVKWTLSQGTYSSTDIGTLVGGFSSAAAINDSNIVVGKSNYASGQTHDQYHGFLFDTQIHELMPYSGTDYQNSYGSALDNATPNPRVVGASQDFYHTCTGQNPNHHNLHAMQWQSDFRNPTDLGTLSGGWESHAFSINASQYTAGDSSNGSDPGDCRDTPPHAFQRDNNGTFTQLDLNVSGVGQSRAYGINNASPRQIVGWWGATATMGDLTDGFLWDKNNGFQNLGSLLGSNTGWTNIMPRAINDSGSIVGQGKHNGVLRAFLMSPTTGPSTSNGAKQPPLLDLLAVQTVPPAGVAPALVLGSVQGADQLLRAAQLPEAPKFSVEISVWPGSAGGSFTAPQEPRHTDLFFTSPESELMGERAGWDYGFLQGLLA